MSDGPVALVTAASRGMGAGIARRLATDGYRVSLLARSDDVHELARELGGTACTGSVTELSDLSAFVAHTMEVFGRIDAVVCNTGHPPKGELLEIADEGWHAGLDMVLLNVVRMARLVTPSFEAQGSGAIVNISAFGAREPSLAFPVSSALRAGLGAFVKMYADLYGPAGIRMNNVLPGFIETYEVSDELLAQIPAGRPGSVDEIAGTVAFLLSADAAYINGQSLNVDGGFGRAW